jgi:uncharacterized protein YjbI with pentapeptide repeats
MSLKKPIAEIRTGLFCFYSTSSTIQFLFPGLRIIGHHFNGMDFTEYSFSRMKFLDCEFIEFNLSNLPLIHASFRDVVFRKSKMLALNWSPVTTLSKVTFFESIIDYSAFQSFLRGAVFSKANLSESDYRGERDYFIDVRVTQVTKAKFSLPAGLTLLSLLDITLE